MKRELERAELPGEHEARERAWSALSEAFARRERVPWPRRHRRQLVVAAAAAAVVAAALSPPGLAVLGSLRDAIGRERVVGVRPAHRELIRLPAPGRLLVESRPGTWVVQAGGSRRLLGPYRQASWSPHGLFLAAVRPFELLAIDPKGAVRWSKPRKQQLRWPRWSFEGYRIAYLSDATLRVITGDGASDRGFGNADPRVAPAWRPGTHEVAWAASARVVQVAAADARRLRWRAATIGPVAALSWSDDGRLLLVAERTRLAVYSADGRLEETIALPRGSTLAAAAFRPGTHEVARLVRAGGRSRIVATDANGRSRTLFAAAGRLEGLTWSPDGEWLLASWPAADEWLFVHDASPARLVAVTAISRQFDPGARAPAFPTVGGWCCSPPAG